MAAAVVPKAEERVPAGPPPGIRALGLPGAILVVQFIFFLLAVNNSPALGGGWGPYLIDELTYIVLFISAIVIDGVVEPRGGSDRAIRLWLPDEDRVGVIANFCFWFAVIGLVSLVGGIVLLDTLKVSTMALTGQERINTLVFVLLFVAPTEEFLFRAVLPRRVGWVLGSVVLFAVFHFGAYTTLSGGVTVGTLGNLLFAAILGYFLWLLYDNRTADGRRRMGLGAPVAFHAVYDLFVYGVFTGVFTFAGLFAVAPFVGHP